MDQSVKYGESEQCTLNFEKRCLIIVDTFRDDKDFVLGVMSAAGANTVEEKMAALVVLRQVEVMIAKKSWRKMAKIAAAKKLSKEGAVVTIRQLAKQLGVNITKRKALAVIPIIGAVVGGSMNGWYIKDVGWAARRAFQERWLIDNKKIVDIPPVPKQKGD